MSKTLRNLALVALASVAVAGCASPLGRIAMRSGPQPDPALLAPPVNPDLIEGRKALATGNYGAAIAALRLARLDPDSAAEATNGLGVAYARIGRDDLAERYFRQAIVLAPQDRRFAANLDRFYQVRDARLARLAQAAPKPVAPVMPTMQAGIRVAVGGGTGQRAVAVAPASTGPRLAVTRARTSPAVTVSDGRSRSGGPSPVTVSRAVQVAAIFVDPAPRLGPAETDLVPGLAKPGRKTFAMRTFRDPAQFE